MSRMFSNGGVSQCWHCHKQLQRVRGGFIFALIRLPDNNVTRVHKGCVAESVGDGYSEVKGDAPGIEEEIKTLRERVKTLTSAKLFASPWPMQMRIDDLRAARDYVNAKKTKPCK